MTSPVIHVKRAASGTAAPKPEPMIPTDGKAERPIVDGTVTEPTTVTADDDARTRPLAEFFGSARKRAAV
jgi:hypothetical protein